MVKFSYPSGEPGFDRLDPMAQGSSKLDWDRPLPSGTLVNVNKDRVAIPQDGGWIVVILRTGGFTVIKQGERLDPDFNDTASLMVSTPKASTLNDLRTNLSSAAEHPLSDETDRTRDRFESSGHL